MGGLDKTQIWREKETPIESGPTEKQKGKCTPNQLKALSSKFQHLYSIRMDI